MNFKAKSSHPKATQGFTLIELLIVIAILTVLFAITIIAINPSRQLAQANNTQRRSDVKALLNAIGQYAASNRSSLPAFIPSTSTVQITDSATTGCAITCGAVTTLAACLPLYNSLVPTYLAAIPYDPQQTSASSTHYAVTQSASGNRITVTACDAQLSESISVIQ